MRLTGRPRRWPAGVRLLLLGVVLVVVVAAIGTFLAGRASRPATATESPAAEPLTHRAPLAHLAGPAGAPGPGGDPGRRTLVLYDDGGSAPSLGHQYAVQAANLASRGGAWTMAPVRRYRAGEMASFQSVIYIGAGDGSLPLAFLADAARRVTPLLWLGQGAERLFQYDRSASRRFGWSPSGQLATDVTGVRYQGRVLPRQAKDNEALVGITVHNGTAAQVLGLAQHADGRESPWAVRSGTFTYIGEVPFSYAMPGDRYLAAADLILGLVAPESPRRHRALIRLEDVGPNTNPHDIRAIADYLSSQGVPFTLAVYPYYRDPHGNANSGRPTSARLVDRPELVDALKYATQRGGVMIMHGYTHQLDELANPYSAISGDDYEFFLAHVDQANDVRLDGPTPLDSRAWVDQRLSTGRAEFVRAGFGEPGIFEFPHYTGSAASYRAVHAMFGVRYDQGTYFDGLCPEGDCANETAPDGELFQQFFPYPVRDVYGSVVIPENMLNVSIAYNNNPARSPRDILASAEAMTVVRDGVASTFYHPFLGTSMLAEVVGGIRDLGYTFVSPYDLLR